MAHHGMNSQHGINAMCKSNSEHEGRFGRIFKNLNPNYTDPSELKKLGRQGGPMDGGQGRNRSESIPMGHVFFGQFIDHDITLDTTSALDRVNDENATENFRTPALDLDNIYGSGPEASGYLYKDGLYLLTGSDGTALAGQAENHRENDLVRNSVGTAIIGDPRNDENRIISQLQLAFINFHNKVVDYVKAEHPSFSKSQLFEEAKELVIWHYQWIILNEFLPIMIGKPLLSEIKGKGRKHYNPRKSFIPIEFSAAAYRFGHSLAPQALKVRTTQAADFDLFGPSLGRGFSPITDDRQIVEWETMFDITNDDSYQRTDKLDTKMPSDLLALPFIRPPAENSLATRNLQRGQSFLLPSGENVARAIGVPEAEITQLLTHISNNTVGIDLSNGVPLWYYILAEAEVFGRKDIDGNKPGEGLGPVGGTIVGETLVGLIELDAMSYLGKNRNWSPTLRADGTFTMADLLTFNGNVVA